MTRYLLAPDHPDGGSKARFFLTRGYRLSRPKQLVDDLLEIARFGPVAETLRTPHGTKYIVDGTVEPVDPGPRLVTAYPI